MDCSANIYYYDSQWFELLTTSTTHFTIRNDIRFPVVFDDDDDLGSEDARMKRPTIAADPADFSEADPTEYGYVKTMVSKPAKAEAAPADAEAVPAKVEAAPAEAEASLKEAEVSPAQVEGSPAETEASPAEAAPKEPNAISSEMTPPEMATPETVPR